ncbi:conserved Plasmodium protein, unknown function [Plasmodium ovale curtisi]|uniref:Uncharacterized protein n=1 Tax=Plasmodium ovale curtisi TaxID=864141 RepID=A0A1A8VZP3_PLAOA|nr:conserved Plasmodium protein, unknown function [Plasmodium ovale curtisi]
MAKEKENMINCRRVHRANMIFATISNDYNYICIITFYENNYNLELFSANNQMQKIFRKTIPDKINKVYINYNNKYICVTSQNGSIYIFDMKDYAKQTQRKTSSFCEDERKKDDSKNKIASDNAKKKFPSRKTFGNSNLTTVLCKNKIKKKNGRQDCEKNGLSYSGKNERIENKNGACSRKQISQKDDTKNFKQNTNVKKSNIHISRNETHCSKKEGKEKQCSTVLENRQELSHNVDMYNSTSEESSADNEESENEYSDDNFYVNSNFISDSEFPYNNGSYDHFVVPSFMKNGTDGKKAGRSKNPQEEYEKHSLEVVDIYWICIEKEKKHKFTKNSSYFHNYFHNYFDSYNFYHNLHIIYSLDEALHIVCSINLKIVIFKYNILEHFYHNMHSYHELKCNIISTFREEFVKKCKKKNKHLYLSCIHTAMNSCGKDKVCRLNLSMGRYTNSQHASLQYAHSKGSLTPSCNPYAYHINVKEEIIKKIFSDTVVRIKQTYVSNDQHYILVNYCISVKNKYVRFSSLKSQVSRKKGAHEGVVRGKRSVRAVDNEEMVQDRRATHDGRTRLDLVRMCASKVNVGRFAQQKEQLCLVGIQKTRCIDNECKSVEKIALYMLYSFDIVQNIFLIYGEMANVYSKFDEYKKLYRIYENILQVKENFKKFYYRDRAIIYFSKYVKNRKENFDENLYNLFFKENEKEDFAHYYNVIHKMISDNTVCCSCSKEKFFKEKWKTTSNKRDQAQNKDKEKEKEEIHKDSCFPNKGTQHVTARKDNGIRFFNTSPSVVPQAIRKKHNQGENIKRHVLDSHEGDDSRCKSSSNVQVERKLCGKRLTSDSRTKWNNGKMHIIDHSPFTQIKGEKRSTNCKSKMCMPYYHKKGEKEFLNREKKKRKTDHKTCTVQVKMEKANIHNGSKKRDKEVTSRIGNQSKCDAIMNPARDYPFGDHHSGEDTFEGEEDTSEDESISMSETELEKCFLKSRKFIIQNGENICENCRIVLNKNVLHNFENFELNYEIPKKKKKLTDEEIYSSLIKDIYIMYREKKCPINILLLLQELSDKELESYLGNFQLILRFFERTFMENVNEHLNNLLKILNICKTLSNGVNVMLKKRCNYEIERLHNRVIYCLKKFQSFYKLQTKLNIFLFIMELLLFISKNIYFENFPHYKETFSNDRYIEILKSYDLFRNYKMNFSYFDEYLHKNCIKSHKFYIRLNRIRKNLVYNLQSFACNNNYASLYNVSLLHVPLNKYSYFTLPKNDEKYISVNNFSYFDDFMYKTCNSLFYPFYVCTCDKYTFVNIKKYYQSDLTFKLIQRKALNIDMYPLRVLNIIAISKNSFYIFTKGNRKLNVTSLKVKYSNSKKKSLKCKGSTSTPSDLCVLNCSNLENYFPHAENFNLKINILYNSIMKCKSGGYTVPVAPHPNNEAAINKRSLSNTEEEALGGRSL